jgi:2-keto-4-pentenoate hydratase/2-oxohepta-3-ene-1,7-dioic acid hydratase in catechol pathway
MQLIRARVAGSVVLARVEGDRALVIAKESEHVAADVLREALALQTKLEAVALEEHATAELELLSPVANPSKIVCVGLNYLDHAAESGQEAPSRPLLFGKFSNALVGPGDPVRFSTAETTQVDYEGELAVVIGRTTSDVPVNRALDQILGYTIANDVSARDAQFGDGQWLRGKSLDTFCPLGPVVVTRDEIPDVQDLRIQTTVNDELLQDGSTADMVFNVAELVSYVSRYLTLLPGDLILTGTPPGVGFARTPPIFLGDGDTVSVQISGIGTLTNTVSAG